MSVSERMTPVEWRTSMGLAGVFGLRMVGLFSILPIFAWHAEHMPGGSSQILIGLALGAYGLTQAFLQIPFGMAADRFGRKRVIYLGLVLFALGSFVAAAATDIHGIILGRSLQGAGAISAAITALLADLTREEHRTKAMAVIGMTIGVTFSASLVMGPLLDHLIGLSGIFAMTGFMAILAMGVVKWMVPNPQISRFHSDAETLPSQFVGVLKNTQLMRLNFGIFSLHAAQMAMFVIVPGMLHDIGNMPVAEHWKVYLPVTVVSFFLMVPFIIYGEKKAKLKQVFAGAIALMMAVQLGFMTQPPALMEIIGLLFFYFLAFNVLEATLPSMISKIAPAMSKGTAMGIYNTSQSLGLFAGGAIGGFLAHHFGPAVVFGFAAAMMLTWLMLALTMQPPPAVSSKMYHVEGLTGEQARGLAAKLSGLQGVREAIVLAGEGVALLKVDQKGWDQAGAEQLIGVGETS